MALRRVFWALAFFWLFSDSALWANGLSRFCLAALGHVHTFVKATASDVQVFDQDVGKFFSELWPRDEIGNLKDPQSSKVVVAKLDGGRGLIAYRGIVTLWDPVTQGAAAHHNLVVHYFDQDPAKVIQAELEHNGLILGEVIEATSLEMTVLESTAADIAAAKARHSELTQIEVGQEAVAMYGVRSLFSQPASKTVSFFTSRGGVRALGRAAGVVAAATAAALFVSPWPLSVHSTLRDSDESMAMKFVTMHDDDAVVRLGDSGYRDLELLKALKKPGNLFIDYDITVPSPLGMGYLFTASRMANQATDLHAKMKDPKFIETLAAAPTQWKTDPATGKSGLYFSDDLLASIDPEFSQDHRFNIPLAFISRSLGQLVNEGSHFSDENFETAIQEFSQAIAPLLKLPPPQRDFVLNEAYFRAALSYWLNNLCRSRLDSLALTPAEINVVAFVIESPRQFSDFFYLIQTLATSNHHSKEMLPLLREGVTHLTQPSQQLTPQRRAQVIGDTLDILFYIKDPDGTSLALDLAKAHHVDFEKVQSILSSYNLKSAQYQNVVNALDSLATSQPPDPNAIKLLTSITHWNDFADAALVEKLFNSIPPPLFSTLGLRVIQAMGAPGEVPALQDYLLDPKNKNKLELFLDQSFSLPGQVHRFPRLLEPALKYYLATDFNKLLVFMQTAGAEDLIKNLNAPMRKTIFDALIYNARQQDPDALKAGFFPHQDWISSDLTWLVDPTDEQQILAIVPILTDRSQIESLNVGKGHELRSENSPRVAAAFQQRLQELDVHVVEALISNTGKGAYNYFTVNGPQKDPDPAKAEEFFRRISLSKNRAQLLGQIFDWEAWGDSFEIPTLTTSTTLATLEALNERPYNPKLNWSAPYIALRASYHRDPALADALLQGLALHWQSPLQGSADLTTVVWQSVEVANAPSVTKLSASITTLEDREQFLLSLMKRKDRLSDLEAQVASDIWSAALAKSQAEPDNGFVFDFRRSAMKAGLLGKTVEFQKIGLAAVKSSKVDRETKLRALNSIWNAVFDDPQLRGEVEAATAEIKSQKP